MERRDRADGPLPASAAVLLPPCDPLRLPARSRIVQFDWRRRWKVDVEPHLNHPLVRTSVGLGMKLFDPSWTRADGPHAIGRGDLNGQRVVEDKLYWYQPWGRCHWISFFACAVGVLSYPALDWHFASGDCHTVPVGSLGGRTRVVMDILNFEGMTAVESLALTRLRPPGVRAMSGNRWAKVFAWYVAEFVPALREVAGRASG